MKAYYRRASANYALGKLKVSQRDFEAVLRIVPKDKDALQKLKQCKKEIKAEQFNHAIISVGESVLGTCLGHAQVDSMVVVDSYDGPRLPDITPKSGKKSKNDQQLNRENKDKKEGKDERDEKDKKNVLTRGDSEKTDMEDDSSCSGDESDSNSDDSVEDNDIDEVKTKHGSSSNNNNLKSHENNDENNDDAEDDDEDDVEDEENDGCDNEEEEENQCPVTMDFIVKMIVCFASQKKLHIKYVLCHPPHCLNEQYEACTVCTKRVLSVRSVYCLYEACTVCTKHALSVRSVCCLYEACTVCTTRPVRTLNHILSVLAVFFFCLNFLILSFNHFILSYSLVYALDRYVCKILLLATDHFEKQPSLLRLTLPVLKNGNDDSEILEELNNLNLNGVNKGKMGKKGKKGKKNNGKSDKQDTKDEKDKINKIDKIGSFTVCGDTHGQFFDLCHIF